MKKIYTILFLFLFTGVLSAQSYNNPESAVYDPVNDQYLISNAGDGTIVAADVNNHNLSSFVSGLNSPKGMCVHNNILYVADVTELIIIDLNSSSISQSVPITDAQQLNDVSAANDSVYISDMQANKIFYYKISSSENGLLSDAWGLNKPNGILFDSKHQLLVVSNIDKSPIQRINRSNGTVGFEMGTAISKLDGLTQDANGKYYVSSWESDVVYQFDGIMSPPTSSDIVVSGVQDPADIYYDVQYDVLIVPNFTNSTVDFIDATSLNVKENKKESIQIYPIPGKENIHIKIPDKYVSSNNKATVYAIDGKVVNQFALDKQKITLSHLKIGTYIIEFDLGEESISKKVLINE